MLEQVPFTRLKYYADYCALTKRMGFPVRHYAIYSKNPPKKAERHAVKNATYYPKYSHYLYRNSNLSPYPKTDQIKAYDKPIYMFAIQDSFSRFIVHACLREQPTSNFRYLHSWYKVEDCFREAFEEYGKPFELVIDRTIKHDYGRMLQDYCTIITGADHPAYSASLERFFLSVQYEMRTELTQENLEKYIHFYNLQRPHSALEGYTPACAWITGSKERFDTFVKNTQNEDKKKVFKDIRELFEINYLKTSQVGSHY